jgi:hypothetical protein
MKLIQIPVIVFLIAASMQLGIIVTGHSLDQLGSGLWVGLAMLWAINCLIITRQLLYNY